MWEDVHPGRFLQHQRKTEGRKPREMEDKEKRYQSQLRRERNERWHEKGIAKTRKARSNKSTRSQSGHREEGGETTTPLSPGLTE